MVIGYRGSGCAAYLPVGRYEVQPITSFAKFTGSPGNKSTNMGYGTSA